MITLQKFEHLITASIAQKPITLSHFDVKGKELNSWILSLSGLPKYQQCVHLDAALRELLISDMSDVDRLNLMMGLEAFVERVIGQLHNDYIYEHQTLSNEQQASIHEVRSLYFLMILIYRGIAWRHQVAPVAQNHGVGWAGKIMQAGVKKSSAVSDGHIKIVSVHQMLGLYVKLLLEYALTYQRPPKVIWQEINGWYLKAIDDGVESISMDKVYKNLKKTTIHHQYMQACAASFGNLFAYRRQDILNAFKVFPSWVGYVTTTFEPTAELRIFVNLEGSEPPEVITPYASVNPYSDEQRCLFFDTSQLLRHIAQVQAGEYLDGGAQSLFESRFAKMVLLAFERRYKQEQLASTRQHKAELLIGFSSVFHAISNGDNLSVVIRERSLPADYHVKINAVAIGEITPKETVIITHKNDVAARFRFNQNTEEDEPDVPLSHPLIPVFGLFALKSPHSTNKHPWRLGIVHWVGRTDGAVEIDGRFIGRVLMAGGVRLRKKDGRSQEFVHGLLVSGDELNEQTTLVIPRYHFKVGDFVVLRIDTKEIELRLERNLLTTDEIEQYQIVRLGG